MIQMNDRDQCIGCTVCGETTELTRGNLRHPEQLIEKKERMAEEHAPCEEFKHNPERARAERQYRQAMREELEKQNQRDKGRR